MKLKQFTTYGNIDRDQENYISRFDTHYQANEVNFEIANKRERLESVDLSKDDK